MSGYLGPYCNDNDEMHDDAPAPLEPCGYCGGSGRVDVPLFDREGRRRENPGTVVCEYCYGSGECEEGHKLLPARRRGHVHTRDCYDDAGPGAGGVSLICGKAEGE